MAGALVARGVLRAGGATGATGSGPDRTSDPSLPAMLMVEAVGTFLLVYVVARLQARGAGQPHAAAVVGVSVMAIMVAEAQVDAGLVNPALGVATAVVGLVPPAPATAGVAAQLCGAVAAALAAGPVSAVPAIGATCRPSGAVVPRPRPSGDDGVVRRPTAPVAMAPTTRR